MTTLEMVGRFAELARVAEHRLAEQARPATSVPAPLCRTYSKLKEHRKLTTGLDQLEQQVRSGHTTIVTDRADISNSDATPLANMLRAEAAIELGDYTKAIDEARIGYERRGMPAKPCRSARRLLRQSTGSVRRSAPRRTRSVLWVTTLIEYYHQGAEL